MIIEMTNVGVHNGRFYTMDEIVDWKIRQEIKDRYHSNVSQATTKMLTELEAQTESRFKAIIADNIEHKALTKIIDDKMAEYEESIKQSQDKISDINNKIAELTLQKQNELAIYDQIMKKANNEIGETKYNKEKIEKQIRIGLKDQIEKELSKATDKLIDQQKEIMNAEIQKEVDKVKGSYKTPKIIITGMCPEIIANIDYRTVTLQTKTMSTKVDISTSLFKLVKDDIYSFDSVFFRIRGASYSPIGLIKGITDDFPAILSANKNLNLFTILLVAPNQEILKAIKNKGYGHAKMGLVSGVGDTMLKLVDNDLAIDLINIANTEFTNDDIAKKVKQFKLKSIAW